MWKKMVLIAILQFLQVAWGATQVTQYGITWTFDGDYNVGQFVNGDYWVVGPVTITEVSPAWDGEKHGSMVDPVPLSPQGYDSRLDMTFSEANRVSFPVTLSGIRSLISVKSLPEVRPGGAHEGLETASVLTVVSEPPPAGSFRPPYVSGEKPTYNVSQIDYSQLPLLPVPPVTLPNFSTMMKRVWLDHGPKVSGATIHPKDNMPPYPRDSSEQVQEMALLVMLDIQEREELVIRLIQLGIDLYSISLENGDAWRAYGGFGSGRKWPIIFAGMMLDDPDMQRPPETIAPDTDISKFGEDGHTYYGQPTTTYPDGKPLWGQDCVAGGYGFGPYWVNHDCRDPNGILEAEDMENGGAYRLCCTSHTWVGQALAARIMRGANLWGWPPFFQYVERWINETGNYGGPFVEYMWTTYAILYTIASGVEGWNYYD